MIKRFLFFLISVLLLVACNTNDKYDSAVCLNFINKYSYESAFNGNSDQYAASLKSISQDEFSTMIGQLKGIITQAYTELTNISVLDNRTEMRERYEQFNDKIMLQQFKILNGIVDDANSRGLLNDKNKKYYDVLEPITKEVASTDISIRNMLK